MRIAVLIPTIFRPDGLRRALSTLYETVFPLTFEHEIDAIVAGEKEDVEACKIAAFFGAAFVTCPEPLQGPGYAYNVALSYAKYHHAYFLASDDCEFQFNWLEEMLLVLSAELDGSGLVGINDNRKNSNKIKRGEVEPTHYLMTRDFIVEHNGGIAAYPYPVDWTDIEACQKARRANKFAYAERAFVTHKWIGLHPDEHFIRNREKKTEAKLLYTERKILGFPDDVEAILK